MFTWADCAAPFGCLNPPGFENEDHPTGLPVVSRDASEGVSSEMLLEAAETGDLETVVRIIESKEVDINAVDDVDSYSALMMSAEAGHLEIVKALIEAGAQVEIRDSYGRTPLYAAAVAGHIEIVRFLVRDASADVQATDCEDRSVLWASCAVRRIDIAAVLLEDNECNLNTVAGSGETAMDFAIKHGHAEVADFLRANGAIDSHLGRLSVH
mmetsp:Transcript_20560/g.26639  ORF Transcript_20560/g.26639 Transcript_20560/m.26639 type:complete len:212 (-) Transcript_20560:117-752(-)|eukprot:CAMPEP_0197294648 /NCGR_PEP_ID=MMETSP0890-20130614/33201_1 /TAXON_ID=44058 ORGANISM="Aureoumbra lagunensis, Strain CCMP1510" /NCGR_SAMPLE_ID=MMETSP0890 /ASSEMBLY_ACC=CAM_ASM_000533 /LENGTH=211 /DNA_ID=CAMNT_0042770189 /DNA_START=28 /DNA_END=663 /DNA_ORIENTATION=-